MKQTKYDIFISYRRQGGYETALPIVEKLRSAGYRVFFDLETMNAGKFNEQLINVIKSCTDFILVLPEGGLDRCSDPNDWVRKEIECAMDSGKNIIPVMLKGFKWPDTFPDSLVELPNYQGISATTPEHFDLAINRLKGYLKSEPRRPWKRWMAYTASSVAAILLIVGGLWLAYSQMAKPIAKDAATRLTFATNIFHEMYAVNEDFNRAWDAYIATRAKADPGSAATLDQEFLDNIDKFYIPKIEALGAAYPDFQPFGSFDRKLLGHYDIDPADIDGLPFLVKSQTEEFIDNFYVHGEIIRQQMFNTASLKNLQDGKAADLYGRNMLYYLYWAELSKLPEEARVSHRQSVTRWNLYPTVSENLSPDDYKQMAEAESRKLEKAIASKEMLIEMVSNKTNQLEEHLFDMQQDLSKIQSKAETPEAATSPEPVAQVESEEVKAAKERIEQRKKEVAKQSDELAQAEAMLRDQYENFKSKYALAASDGQYEKWWKITKAAEYLNTTLDFNRKRAQMGMAPAITNDEALTFLKSQLDRYGSAHPDTKAYVATAKAFYTDVTRGSRPMKGVIIMGTQNDLPHPIFKIGDIVIERNGHAIDCAATFDKSQSTSGTDTVKFLRLSNGKLAELTEAYQRTNVNVGFLPLINN